MTISVAQLLRHPVPGNHSVERIFEDVRAHLPSDIATCVHINRYPSTGTVNRLRDAFAARATAADVRHITGDVHYLAWFLPRASTLLTILDCVTLERLSGLRREVFKALWYTIPLRHAARVTTISTFSAQSIERYTGFPADRVAIIPPPLSPEFAFDPRPFAANRPRILQVGTIANKNIERVIAALGGLDVVLVLVGVLTAQHLAALAKSGVAFENHVAVDRATLLALYRGADIVMFASLYEGFGMPIVEAQAVGRPVVTSDRCAMPETAGDGAILIDPEDVDAIRHAVITLCEDEARRQDLVTRGRRNAARYEPDRVAAAYAALYRDLAA